jgi:dTMP kinase
LNRRGYFISLEGPDGAGKTTQQKILARAAQSLGLTVTCTREPGGTALGDAVRAILLDPAYRNMTILTEVFLYAAARAQGYQEIIGPALQRGEVVISDRYLDSSLAYQAYAGGADEHFVLDVNLKATEQCLPDRTFLLDLPPQAGLARRAACHRDRMELKPTEFHRRVREGFLLLATRFPERIIVVDAALPEDEVADFIWRQCRPVLQSFTDNPSL